MSYEILNIWGQTPRTKVSDLRGSDSDSYCSTGSPQATNTEKRGRKR